MGNSISFNNGMIKINGYLLCPVCKSKTVSVSKGDYWDVNDEPFKEGESIIDIQSTIKSEIEITGQYCLECKKMIAISVIND